MTKIALGHISSAVETFAAKSLTAKVFTLKMLKNTGHAQHIIMERVCGEEDQSNLTWTYVLAISHV